MSLARSLTTPTAAVRAKESRHLPAVLTKEETQRVLAQLSGLHRLQAKLLYGSGLRLLECLRLRVKDVRTTMSYTHVLQRGGLAVRSPLD